MESIKAALREFICQQFYVKPEDLRDDVALIPTGVVDSTGFLEIVTWVEDTCAIKVNDSEIVEANWGSIDRMIAFIARKQAEK